MAHLRPSSARGQQVLDHQLSILPAPARQSESIDAYGNPRAFFSLRTRHETLQVVAESTVVTSAPVVTNSGMAWEEARERLRYHRGAAYDPAAEFVFASPYVPRHDDFVAYAQPCFLPGRPLLEAASELMARIHADFTYDTEVTDVSTPVREALSMRHGVCQDFAHVMIACLRSLGLPARYVSGYLLTAPPPGQPRLLGSDASHAWVSIYLPASGGPGEWTDLDPTNNRPPGEDYVTLATGRDYSDVAPLRGVLHGGANHELHVAVTVTLVEQGSTGAHPTIA